MNSHNRSFLSLRDVSSSEIRALLRQARQLKAEKKRREFPERLKKKNVALLFEKMSTRTRCSFSVACQDEGAQVDFLGCADIHFGKKESLEDTARVLGRFYDGIVYRGFAQRTVETLSELSGVPVFNALTDEEHPTQALADLMTLDEHFANLAGLKIVYLGDAGNNVALSLMQASALVGAHFVCAAPARCLPSAVEFERIRQWCRVSGGSLSVEEDPMRAVEGADALYTDVWVSMGFESAPGMDERVRFLQKYQVNRKLMAATGKNETVFLHCLPANKGLEVTHDVFESSQSLVFEQAENRLHTIKSVLTTYLT